MLYLYWWPDIILPKHWHTLNFDKFCCFLRRRRWRPTPVLLPGKSHGRRSLLGYSPLGREESDTTEWLHFHFSLACIGEGNGNPLQCSCLENPRDGGTWWAGVYGVAQSRTRLKRLSSSSSRHPTGIPGGASDKEPTCQWRRRKRPGFDAWVGKIPWRRKWQPTPVFLPGGSPWTEDLGRQQTVRRVQKSLTWLKWLSMHSNIFFNVTVVRREAFGML